MEDLFMTHGDSISLISEVELKGNYEYIMSPPGNLMCSTCPRTRGSQSETMQHTLQVKAIDQV
ncbi:hypothetical protein SAMN04487995_0402 [Dyadobacter koreensis]|uniref:Uncharacterized protein n=1 Tax=Dyadobacter koreensis TaxID=408657 RepID=A0A1H6Q8E6_9BACT|nr:hypothetical protein SAMN04487995_0402 [Dyadobacter koreensis]